MKKLFFLSVALLMSVGIFAQTIPFDSYGNILLSDYSEYSDDTNVTFVINNGSSKAIGWGVAKIMPINNRADGSEKYMFVIENDPAIGLENSYTFTIAQLKEFAKMDGSYYTDDYDQQGLSVDTWDGAELLSITVAGDGPVVPGEDAAFNFEDDAIGTAYAMETHNAGDGTAAVAANPTNASEKSLKVVVSNYNGRVKFNVTLPNGKTLADYTSLDFDTYWSLTGDDRYKEMEIYIDGNEFVKTGYDLQGETNVWTPHTYPLAALPTALASLNSFELQIGINLEAGEYYMDNIRFVSVLTSLDETSDDETYFANDTVHMSSAGEIQVYDVNGRLLTAKQNVTELNIGNYNAGIYIIRTSINGKMSVNKIIK